MKRTSFQKASYIEDSVAPENYAKSFFFIKADQFISSLPRKTALILAYLVVAVVALLDHVGQYRFGLSRFYLVPIFFLAWALGRKAGLLMAGISALLWAVSDIFRGVFGYGSMIPYWNAFVRLAYLAVAAFVVSALRNALKHEYRLARTDFLTRVANRRHFFEMASAEIQRSLRYHHPFIVSYIDIDAFKAINDRFGHAAGDSLLRLVAQSIQSSLRSIDVIARLGGDEFAILLPETGPEAAREVMKKVHANLTEKLKDHNWQITFSIGTVTYVNPPASVDEMIKKADVLMYAVKTTGKNTIKHEVMGSSPSIAAKG